jgi:hypothetical protein
MPTVEGEEGLPLNHQLQDARVAGHLATRGAKTHTTTTTDTKHDNGRGSG